MNATLETWWSGLQQNCPELKFLLIWEDLLSRHVISMDGWWHLERIVSVVLSLYSGMNPLSIVFSQNNITSPPLPIILRWSWETHYTGHWMGKNRSIRCLVASVGQRCWSGPSVTCFSGLRWLTFNIQYRNMRGECQETIIPLVYSWLIRMRYWYNFSV